MCLFSLINGKIKQVLEEGIFLLRSRQQNPVMLSHLEPWKHPQSGQGCLGAFRWTPSWCLPNARDVLPASPSAQGSQVQPCAPSPWQGPLGGPRIQSPSQEWHRKGRPRSSNGNPLLASLLRGPGTGLSSLAPDRSFLRALSAQEAPPHRPGPSPVLRRWLALALPRPQPHSLAVC